MPTVKFEGYSDFYYFVLKSFKKKQKINLLQKKSIGQGINSLYKKYAEIISLVEDKPYEVKYLVKPRYFTNSMFITIPKEDTESEYLSEAEIFDKYYIKKQLDNIPCIDESTWMRD